MSLKIGTNIEFNGRKFLDSRQGKANTVEDLKNWSTLVPDGFEVYVSGSWYVYSSSLPIDHSTGHFHKRLDYDIPGSQYETRINAELQEIRNILADVSEITVTSKSGGGVYEAGRLINPAMTWTIEVGGEEVIPSDVLVNGASIGPRNYYTEANLGEDKVYNIEIQYSSLSTELSFEYNFVDKSFWGVSSDPSLSSPPEGFDSDLFLSLPEQPTAFDCSGGKYPYYFIPASLGSIEKFVVGGIPTTDLNTKTVTLVNSYGKESEYTVTRLGNKYNGNLKIRIENEE